MKCKLCKSEKNLMKSHVIPEFLYAPLYDDKHRFHVLSAKGKYHQYEQKGLREKLLCNECEGKLNVNETYCSRVFRGAEGVNVKQNGGLLYVSGLNYQKFKLFGMSIVWRAGVSNLKMFEKVSLGPHEERLRALLNLNDHGFPHEYGFVISPLIQDHLESMGLIVQPTKSRISGCVCYRFVFGGLAWAFIVSSHKPEAIIENSLVNTNGEMVMIESKTSELTFLNRGLASINENAL